MQWWPTYKNIYEKKNETGDWAEILTWCLQNSLQRNHYSNLLE